MKVLIQWQNKSYDVYIKNDAINGMSTLDFYSAIMAALPNDDVSLTAKQQQTIKLFNDSGDRLFIYPQRPLVTLKLRDGQKVTAVQSMVPSVLSPNGEGPSMYQQQYPKVSPSAVKKGPLQIETHAKQNPQSIMHHDDNRLSSPVIESFRERRSSAILSHDKIASPLQQLFSPIIPVSFQKGPKFDREFYESPFPSDMDVHGVGKAANEFTEIELTRSNAKHKKNQSEPEKHSKFTLTLNQGGDGDDEFGLKRAQSLLESTTRAPQKQSINSGQTARTSQDSTDSKSNLIIQNDSSKDGSTKADSVRTRRPSKNQIQKDPVKNETQPKSSLHPVSKTLERPPILNSNPPVSYVQPAPSRLLLPDLETIKFILRRGPRDNDSLMRCISFLLLGSATPESVQQIREIIASAALANPNSYANDNLTLLAQAYAKDMAQPNKLMGGEAELNFFARYFDIKIFVIEMVLGRPEHQDLAPDDSNNETFVHSYRRNTETQQTFFEKIKNRVLKGPQIHNRIVYYDGTDFSALGTKYLFNAKQFEIDKLSETSNEDFAIILRKNTHGFYDAFVMLQKDPQTNAPVDEHIFNFRDLGGRRRLLKHLCKISLMITDDAQLPKFIAHKEPFMTKKQAMALFLGICILACVIVLGISILRLLGLTSMGI